MSSILQAPELISPNQVPPFARFLTRLQAAISPAGLFFSQAWPLPSLYPHSGALSEKNHTSGLTSDSNHKPQRASNTVGQSSHTSLTAPLSQPLRQRALSPFPFRNFQDLSLLCHPVLWLWSNASQIPATNPNIPGFQLVSTWYLSTDLK